jgi:putative tryptophan/tyrosine transport system substrate-binding protein
MAIDIRRREFIVTLGSAAAWPLAARAQPTTERVRRIGVLMNTTADDPEGQARIAALHQGLQEWGRSDLLTSLAVDLVRANVSVIAAVSGAPAARAARAATHSIPVVFITPGDPVQQGLVSALNKPDGNLTGLTTMNTLLTAKQIELMSESLPDSAAIAILTDPNTETEELEGIVRVAGQKLGRRIVIVPIANENEFAKTIAAVAAEGNIGLVVPDRPLFVSRQDQLAALVTHHALPAIFPPVDLAASRTLMSYGANTFDVFRRAGVLASKILRGAQPSELPVEQPTRIILKVNLKAATALGLTIPPALLLRADEVIE